MDQNAASTNLIELASDIVSAYVTQNSVPVGELPALIANVHLALTKLGSAA
jgi:predicted transcriptional regulator